MRRLVSGILKGLVAGAAVGAGAWALGIHEGILLYLVYGVAGALAGLVCGKAPWRHETLWTPAIKAVIGFGVGAGLYYAWVRMVGDLQLPMAAQLGAPAAPMASIPYLLGPLIGLVYGVFVEIDDGAGGGRATPRADARKP